MKIHPLSVLASIGILLLMGVISAVYDVNSGSPIGYLAMPMMGGECMKCLEGKTVDLHHIATEHSRTSSNWRVEKGGPARVTFLVAVSRVVGVNGRLEAVNGLRG